MRHPIGVDDGFTPYPTQELPSTQPTVNTVTQRALRLGIDEVCPSVCVLCKCYCIAQNFGGVNFWQIIKIK